MCTPYKVLVPAASTWAAVRPPSASLAPCLRPRPRPRLSALHTVFSSTLNSQTDFVALLSNLSFQMSSLTEFSILSIQIPLSRPMFSSLARPSLTPDPHNVPGFARSSPGMSPAASPSSVQNSDAIFQCIDYLASARFLLRIPMSRGVFSEADRLRSS